MAQEVGFSPLDVAFLTSHGRRHLSVDCLVTLPE